MISGAVLCVVSFKLDAQDLHVSLGARNLGPQSPSPVPNAPSPLTEPGHVGHADGKLEVVLLSGAR